MDAEILLHKELLDRLIGERFASKAAFCRASGVHKSTLGRWFSGQYPPSAETYLKVCGALDVDPLALVEVPLERIPMVLLRIIQEAASGQWSKQLSPLSFLRDLIPAPWVAASAGKAEPADTPCRDSWPPESIPGYYPSGAGQTRGWERHVHPHDPASCRASYYGAFLLRPSVDPQVWYFAFRRADEPLVGWWWYGFVRYMNGEVLLLNFSSEYMLGAPSPGCGQIGVETYFEPVKMDFQVASLHPFELQFEEELPDDWQGTPVRFRHPHT
jgi:transcriptional regulator with XRE-family HTH domain